jgi:hypothetical protein
VSLDILSSFLNCLPCIASQTLNKVQYEPAHTGPTICFLLFPVYAYDHGSEVPWCTVVGCPVVVSSPYRRSLECHESLHHHKIKSFEGGRRALACGCLESGEKSDFLFLWATGPGRRPPVGERRARSIPRPHHGCRISEVPHYTAVSSCCTPWWQIIGFAASPTLAAFAIEGPATATARYCDGEISCTWNEVPSWPRIGRD